jgi:hypothetical protein
MISILIILLMCGIAWGFYSLGTVDGYQKGWTDGNQSGYSIGYRTGESDGKQHYYDQNCFWYPFALLDSSQYVACHRLD